MRTSRTWKDWDPRSWSVRNRIIAIVAAVVLLIAGGAALVVAHRNNAPAAPSATPAPLPPRQTMAFGNGEPGTPEALQELTDAKDAGFDLLMSYNNRPGVSPEAEQAYLDSAQAKGIGSIYSGKDQLGPAADDPDPAATYAKMTADFQAAVSTWCKHPAVKYVLISDEQPAELSDFATWLPRLKQRTDEVHRLCGKQSMAVFSNWGAGTLEELKQVAAVVDQVMIDYYPYPDATTVDANGVKVAPDQDYGTIEEISRISHDLWEAAGPNSWFVFQAMSWQKYPEMVASKHFGDDPQAPNAEWMSYMVCDLALPAGVRNIGMYSMFDIDQAQRQQVKITMMNAKAAHEWRH